MAEEIVFFELNNWFAGRDYPDAEPFLSWMRNDLQIQFNSEDWVKANNLVVVGSIVDMSQNFCISAPRSWVEKNCPELLTQFSTFIRHVGDADDPPVGQFGCPFKEYAEWTIGCHWWDEGKGWYEGETDDDES